ncbi:helix-turn-helix domain-containing protein [Meridianimarinicoccus sp. RP-17]|uniref:helix-turn-helix domain-containing protein n=1 Tax=Meridianimarinicoccus zhengii TaxID=2056810 RepID=UPI001F463952|nr:helix-turn-helix domain-containing protein [Phycocomes zhengii]
MTPPMMGPMEIARRAWGADMPDWIAELAAACAQTSQNQVARRLDRSPSLVSNVLRRKYTGDMDAVEQRVRGVLMRSVVECPQLGTIPAQVCQDWRARSRTFSGHNAQRAQMFRACRACPRNAKEVSREQS